MLSVSAVVGRSLAAVLAALIAFTACLSLRLAYADFLARRDTVVTVAEASDLTPGNAELSVRLAELDASGRRTAWESA